MLRPPGTLGPIYHRIVIGALSALLLVTGCGGDEGSGADRSTTTAAEPRSPGPPADACALLTAEEVEAVVGPPAGKGAGTQSLPEADSSAERTLYADCSWPDASSLHLYLTWVQPPPTPDPVAWVERLIQQSGDLGVDQVAQPFELDGVAAAALVDGDQLLRVATVVGGTDLLSIEALDPTVAVGSPEAEALKDALAAAAGRL